MRSCWSYARSAWIACWVLNLIASPVLADHRSDLANAQRRLERADARLRAEARNIDSIRGALEQARSARDSYTYNLRSILESVQQLEIELRDTEAAIPAVAGRIDEIDRILPERRAAVDELDRSFRDASGVVERIRAKARATFEQSPQYVDAMESLDSARKRLDENIARVLEQLEHDDACNALRDEAARAEARVQTLRVDRYAPAEDLAAASGDWIEAKDAVTRYTREAIDRDQLVVEARGIIAQAEAQLVELNDAFNQSLRADQDLQATLVARDLTAQSLHVAQRELADAEHSRYVPAQQLNALHERASSLQAQLASRASEADGLHRATESADSDIWRLERELDCAISAHSQALWDRNRAEREYRRILDLCHEHERREAEARNKKPIFVGPIQHPRGRHDKYHDNRDDHRHNRPDHDKRDSRDDRDDRADRKDDPPQKPEAKESPRRPIRVGPEPDTKVQPKKPAPVPKQPIRVGPEPEQKSKSKQSEAAPPRPKEPIRVGPEPAPKSNDKNPDKNR